MEKIFFDDWTPLLRTLIIGICAYVALIVILRITGSRTLSKMNAFDFIVTIALGSVLANILLNKDVSLAQGVLGLALLVGLQFVITWSSARARWVQQLVTGQPELLFYRGQFLHRALRRERVTEDEIRSAVRTASLATLDDAEAVVLETDGSFSVIPRGDAPAPELAGIKPPEQEPEN